MTQGYLDRILLNSKPPANILRIWFFIKYHFLFTFIPIIYIYICKIKMTVPQERKTRKQAAIFFISLCSQRYSCDKGYAALGSWL